MPHVFLNALAPPHASAKKDRNPLTSHTGEGTHHGVTEPRSHLRQSYGGPREEKEARALLDKCSDLWDGNDKE